MSEQAAGTTRRGTVDQTAKPRPLHPDNLVDDRELRRADEDRFEHGLRTNSSSLRPLSTPLPTLRYITPGNRGKTGIANLMREKLREHNGIKFARFDAFKYAENPLRRNFVSREGP
jgi:hypothetical protein